MKTSISPPAPLVDQLFAATYHPEQQVDNPYFDKGGHRRVASAMRAALISAKRYFLDDEVVRAATTLGVQHPDVLLAMLSRGRLPFPKIWIEWRQGAVLEEQGIEVAEDAPPLSGAFIEDISAPGEFPIYRITEMGFATGGLPPRAVAHATSIVYCLDQPILERMPSLYQDRSSLARLSGVSKDVMDACLLGSTYSEIDVDMSKYLGMLDSDHDRVVQRKAEAEHRLTLCRHLASYASHAFSPFYPGYDAIIAAPHKLFPIYEHAVKQSLLECSGTWRFVVTVLALLQSRDYTNHEQPPSAGRRRFVGNKVVPYLQYWRVSVKLPRQIILRDMITSVRDSLPKARTDVEGYWREHHHKGDPRCQHVDVTETPDRYRCALCGRARWFTAAHVRGSAEIGYIKKDRVVERRST